MVWEVALGWVLILAGLAMLLAESYHPGFFIAVPGTVLIIFGIASLFWPELLASSLIIFVGVLGALAAAGVTVWFYSRLTPEGTPTTISRDSVIGYHGKVKVAVDPDSIGGKVLIGGVEWSARSNSGTISPGTEVIVIGSEGVHIVVEAC
jgi:membrane protein implicated in regulation of membrane protease activity